MKVNILPDVYKKIMYFVDISDVEVSMMGKVTKSGDEFTIRSVHIADQLNHGTETEMQPEAIGKLLYETRELEGELNCWIHSHVNMGVSRSGTDYATGRQIGANGYCLALIFNKRRDVSCAYYQGESEFLPALEIDSIKVTMQNELTEAEISEWTAEFKSKCKPKPLPVVKKSKGAPIYHGRGVNIGKIWDSVTREWRDIESDGNVKPSLTVKEKKDGQIHDRNYTKRWCEQSSKWLEYSKYWDKHDDMYMDNVIDIVGTREETIEAYVAQYAGVPDNDYLIDEYYMEQNEMTALDFYVDHMDMETVQ